MVDISRGTTGLSLPASVSQEIWANALETSAVMQRSRQIELPGNGVTVHTITGEPVADWVNETDEKPVSRPTLGNKPMTPYKLAVIVPVSKEFTRDAAALYRELVRRLPAALGAKFDATVFHGTAPGSNFDVLSDAQEVGLAAATAWTDLLAVDAAVSDANGLVNGYVLSPKGRGVLMSAVDGNERPLFVNDLQREGGVGFLMGNPVSLSRSAYLADDEATDAAEVLGFAGDWTQAVYGTVEGVQVDVSDQASINDGGTVLHLWQRNMVGVRAEIEVGFVVSDKTKFVKITGANVDNP